MLRSKNIGYDERHERKNKRHSNVASKVGSSGKITIRPTRFIVRMKKKQVRRYGANLFVLSPSVLLIVS